MSACCLSLPIRNRDNQLEVHVDQLLPSPIRVNLQYQGQICLSLDAEGLLGVVALDLNRLPIRSDGILTT